MKQILMLIALFSSTYLMAQKPAPPETNDPAAKKVLDKIRKKYDTYKTMEANFSLQIEVPGQAKETQKGTIAQEDKKFRLEMPDQTIVSDAVSTWVYLKNKKEVQISNADPNDSQDAFLTPKDLLQRYQKGDYLYTLTDKVMEGGVLVTQIEFKPKDRNSEYSKIRVSIDEKASQIKSLKAFSKDGSRFTFTITSFTPNKPFQAGHFAFDPKKVPGVKVEDLRE